MNDTADIVLTLIGEESSIEWILLTCDSDTKPFCTGQLDTFYIPSKNLGKVIDYYPFKRSLSFSINRFVLWISDVQMSMKIANGFVK